MDALTRTCHQYADWSKHLFSELVEVKGSGTLFYLSGIGAEDSDAQAGTILHQGDVYRQTKAAYEKAATLLSRHGAALADVVKITAYLLDPRDFPAYHRARAEAFQGVDGLPAHTLLCINSLAWPDMRVEVELVAAVSGSRQDAAHA